MSPRKKSAERTRTTHDDPSSSGMRAARRVSSPPPAIGPTGPALALDPDLSARMYALVLRVEEASEEGLSLPPDPQWILAADAAKRAGYLHEAGFRLYLTKHGEQWLESRSKPAAKDYTYTKIREAARLQLKDVARGAGVPMQEAIGEIIEAIHQNQDALTRIARKNGAEHAWEALRFLVK
jgi:hypothetical protein